MTAHISFPLWEIDIWQTRSWQIYPPFLSGNFTDSNSDNSYFIPTLRAYHLEDQVLADLSPIKWQFHRFLLYSDSSYLADLLVKWWFHRFLPWQLTSLRAQHLADQVMADLPPCNGDFTDSCSDSSLLWELIIWLIYPSHQMAISQIPALTLPTLRPQHLTDQVLADLNPHIKWQFHRFLWNSYFITTLRAQHLADQVLADLPPSSKAISQIPALIWELIFGRPSVGRSTPCQMAILQIAALTAHISFLLWVLIIWQTRSWQIYLPIQWWFYRFLLWQLTTLRTYHLADQVLADLPPHQMAISQIPASDSSLL